MALPEEAFLNVRLLNPPLASRARKPGAVCDTLVLHATAGSTLEGAISALRSRKLSYHYLIAKNGDIVKCVATGLVAFHAGASRGPQGSQVNDYSIGISFVNLNDGKDIYTPKQLLAAKQLVEALQRAIPTLRHLTTHYAISPGRKTDPRDFPVEALAKETSLSLWPPKPLASSRSL
jgi:N-acetylmuramoyl-L-alanine amidase